MEAQQVKRARSRIDATGTCTACRETADTWYRNLPRTDCEWPGTFPITLAPRMKAHLLGGTIGPLAFKANPRMDIRTPNHTKIAEWDVKNYEQIAHIFDICRQHNHAGWVPVYQES